jgi:plastocyanin
MNKIILVLIIIVVVLIILVGGYFIFSATTNQQQNQPVQSESLSASVSIKNFAFNPTPLTIKVGTTVIWTNNDSAPHQIKSDVFNSATLNNGQTFEFTFSVAGEYDYICSVHPSMKGKIIVTQ